MPFSVYIASVGHSCANNEPYASVVLKQHSGSVSQCSGTTLMYFLWFHNTSSRCKTRATWIHVSAAHWRSCGKRGNKGYWSMWWVWCSEKEIYPWDSKVQVLIFSCNCIWLCCFQSWEKSTAPHPSTSCQCWRVTVANRQTVWTAWRSPGRYNMWQ